MTHDEMIAVIAAHRDGKIIEVRPNYVFNGARDGEPIGDWGRVKKGGDL